MPDPPPQPDGPERFARLFAQHQQALFRYILLLTGRLEDAQDVLQETSVALLRKIDTYDADRPFLPWARRFAYFEVLRHREQSTRRGVLLAPDVLDQISGDAPAAETLLDARRSALTQCLAKLTQPQRELLRQRYAGDATVKSVAQATGRPIQTLYTQLKRLRRTLMDCVDKAVGQEGGP
ncbi:sigma-70 family RNA polymerase sigma factor [Phycisphaeraceae bacterium D3-23]